MQQKTYREAFAGHPSCKFGDSEYKIVVGGN